MFLRMCRVCLCMKDFKLSGVLYVREVWLGWYFVVGKDENFSDSVDVFVWKGCGWWWICVLFVWLVLVFVVGCCVWCFFLVFCSSWWGVLCLCCCCFFWSCVWYVVKFGYCWFEGWYVGCVGVFWSWVWRYLVGLDICFLWFFVVKLEYDYWDVVWIFDCFLKLIFDVLFIRSIVMKVWLCLRWLEKFYGYYFFVGWLLVMIG